MGIAHVMWFVSAIYFVAGPFPAYFMAVVGFGLLAVGFSYSTFRVWLVDSVRGASPPLTYSASGAAQRARRRRASSMTPVAATAMANAISRPFHGWSSKRLPPQ